LHSCRGSMIESILVALNFINGALSYCEKQVFLIGTIVSIH
jgi:hypothetical protein